jgi:hypothetical protein
MSHFTIKIACKKYVKVYLETMCGSPVDITQLPVLYREFKRGLRKVDTSPGISLSQRSLLPPAIRFPELVVIIIPHDTFFRCGYEMNDEDCLFFNSIVEKNVKYIMRQYVALNSAMGVTVADAIRQFQQDFGFNDNVWDSESIKKDFQRNGKKVEMKSLKAVRKEIITNLLNDLIDLGTLAKIPYAWSKENSCDQNLKISNQQPEPEYNS